MLEFWFNKQVPSFKKLMILIIPLNLYWVISISTITVRYYFNVYGNWGYFLICRYFKLHFAQSNPTGLLYRLFTWVPIALLFALIFVKPCLTYLFGAFKALHLWRLLLLFFHHNRYLTNRLPFYVGLLVQRTASH